MGAGVGLGREEGAGLDGWGSGMKEREGGRAGWMGEEIRMKGIVRRRNGRGKGKEWREGEKGGKIRDRRKSGEEGKEGVRREEGIRIYLPT